jgi:pimeloyl-ACP methyl ester carboxylesterase
VAGIDPPFLLVGHSLGGLYARHFATRFPQAVTGLVLLDPAHEDYDAFMPEELQVTKADRLAQAEALTDQAATFELPEEVLGFYRMLFEAEVTGWPEEVRVALVEAHVSPEFFKVGFLEASNTEDLYDEMRKAGALPDVPMIVLCSMGVDDFRRAVSAGTSEEALAQEIEGRRHLYEQFALSVPRGECWPVEGVGHVTMHLRRGDLVLDAINEVMRA